jgi:hypothetical protein
MHADCLRVCAQAAHTLIVARLGEPQLEYPFRRALDDRRNRM